MGETVRAAGVRAARQQRASDWATVKAFLDEWSPEPFVAIVKPIQSAGSDDVFKCCSEEEVRVAFDRINGAINGLGVVNEGVLVQEFLDGPEFVVGSVSRDGVHKVVALWEYDKRAANGQFNVYFGTYFRRPTGPVPDALLAYARSVLDALQIVNGPGHMEVKMTSTGPCLVEVGSRCHGGEGTWQPVALECVGYSQVGATLDVYVNPSAFDALPLVPGGGTLRKFGAEIDIVAYRDGVVTEIPGAVVVRTLPSFRKMELAVQPGTAIKKTVDCFTRPASVLLLHDDEATLLADVASIRGLERDGMFTFRD